MERYQYAKAIKKMLGAIPEEIEEKKFIQENMLTHVQQKKDTPIVNIF
ncbi:MAG: hypothetical protein PHX25_00920 [Candidatus Pacebacteria bacterium]|nr:hypothetical protein [Candidatus Paceibacterota bacterium]